MRHEFNVYTPPNRNGGVTEFLAALRRLNAAARPRRLRRGDKVRVGITGYVQKVHDDGKIDLAATREPYADTLVADIPIRNVVYVDAAPAEPCVGDRIDGKQVRETPWRRGTTLVIDNGASHLGDPGDQLVLLGSGHWVNVDDDTTIPATYAFAEISDFDEFEVMYAPGKHDPADQ